MKIAIDSGVIVHDIDLQKWALQAQIEINFKDVRFKVSHNWLWNLKKQHHIVSRKINKFVTRKTMEGGLLQKKNAEKFVADVVLLIEKYGAENVYNSDQSGFQLEIHSGRTLTTEGMKKVACVVQSVCSTTHSYTIQPTISADGKLLSPLFIVLKEIKGEFGPRVEQGLFQPENVFVMASKSGKLTSEHFKTWMEKVFFPNVGSNSVLLLGSWNGHCPKFVREATPLNKNVIPMIIPKGTAGKIQPLDEFGFRVWKNFV